MRNHEDKDSVQDEGLKGNEQIEEAILALQQESTPDKHLIRIIKPE